MNTSQLTTLLNTNPVLVLTESVTLYAGEVYTLPDDVTIIIQNPNVQFRGTTATNLPEAELKGKRTRLIAPLIEIFKNLNVTGSWIIDRAYPQWFGYTPRKNKAKYEFDDIITSYPDNLNVHLSQNDFAVPDATKAIQKAITMKGNGEVFLTQGFYVLKTPLLIPIGISLVGEKGQGANANNLFFRGTVLQSWKSFKPVSYSDDPNKPITTETPGVLNDDSDEYMLYFNSDTSFNRLYGEGTGFLAGQISEIKNLTIFNCFPDLDDFTGTDEEKAHRLMTETTACVKGIYVADTLSIENVRFEDIRQAVVFANRYIDSKRIVNCAVVTDYNSYFQYLSKDIYAFEMSFLGDDLLFEHNAVDGKYHKGIHLNHCFGGKISCNIINADITIDNSSSLTICNNHIEEGHQLLINCSQVDVCDNYFHLGTEPEILIHGERDAYYRCVVNLNGNRFIFNNIDHTIEGITQRTEWKEHIENLTNFDVEIDTHSIVNIRNTFRYYVNPEAAGKMYPYGIKIRKLIYTFDLHDNPSTIVEPFVEFNRFSYRLSNNCTISTGFVIDKQFTIKTPNLAVNTYKMSNNGLVWIGNSGTYKYYYQIIWDDERKIIGTFNNLQLHEMNDPSSSGLTFTQYSDGGGLIVLSRADNKDEFSFLLRLYRLRTNNNTWETVDVPMCGSIFIYDNGISVGGYKWNGCSNPLQNGHYYYDNDFESVTFQGDSIVCRKLSSVSSQTYKVIFQRGDIIANLGNGSITIITQQ